MNNNNNNDQMISPSAMAKYLEDKIKASEPKHCDTCSCANRDLTVLADTHTTYSVSTQTILQGGDANNTLCLRCSSNLNSPSRTNSPFILKLVKSSDSVISETKSSVSGIGSNDKLFTMNKQDDLVVNPILGHHRLCDRSSMSTAKLLDLAESSADAIQTGDNHPKFKTPAQTNTRVGPMKKTDASLLDSRNGSLQNSLAVAGSSHSMSSRASSQTDGARIFESFNRNLIRSIKVSVFVMFLFLIRELLSAPPSVPCIAYISSNFFIICCNFRLKIQWFPVHDFVPFEFKMVQAIFYWTTLSPSHVQ